MINLIADNIDKTFLKLLDIRNENNISQAMLDELSKNTKTKLKAPKQDKKFDLEEIYFPAPLRRLRGDFEICDIDNNKFEKSFKYTQLQKLCSNNVMEVQTIPPTAKAVGTIV